MRTMVVVWLAASVAVCQAGMESALAPRVVWQQGTGDYHSYRIPAIVTAQNGTLLAFCEGRKSSLSDTGNIDLVLRRSSDSGATWQAQQVVWDDGANVCGNPVPIVDRATGRIVLVMTWNLGSDTESALINGTAQDVRRVYVTHSDDHGATWAAPREITQSVKQSGWGWYATGPGGGIQLQQGTHAGRLVVACDHSDAGKVYRSHVIYSDDGGTTWQLGGVVPDGQLNECQVTELADGRLMLNMRNYNRSTKARRVSYSSDGGATWSAPVFAPQLIEPICQAALRRVRLPEGDTAGIIAFSNPADETSRVRMTLRLSYDEGATWPESKVLHAGHAAYSDLVAMPQGDIGILYECGTAGAYETITFERVAVSKSAATNTSTTPSSSTVFEDGLQLWLRSESGVNNGEADNGHNVSNWTGTGESALAVKTASAFPKYVAQGFQRADGTFSPAVSLNSQMLESDGETTLNVSTDSAWFAVFKLNAIHTQTSLLGLNSSVNSARFGAFIVGTGSNIARVHNSNSSANMHVQLTTNSPACLLDSRRGGGIQEACLDGARTQRLTNASGTLTTAGKFRIGGMIQDVTGKPKADFAEVLIYNRTVNDAERAIIQNYLAAKHGVALAANDYYASSEGPRNGYHRGVVGIGTLLGGDFPGSVTQSTASGGLTLDVLNSTLATSGEFVFAGFQAESNRWVMTDGNNGRMTREWFISKTTADGIDMRLVFDFAGLGVAAIEDVTYSLFYRPSRQAASQTLATAEADGSGAVAFDLPDNDWGEGYYTLGIGSPARVEGKPPILTDGLTTLFRADTGVGLNDGKVVQWDNHYGSLPLNMTPSLETNAPTWAADAFVTAQGRARSGVRFNWDGSAVVAGYPQALKSDVQTVLGISGESTWFAVARARAELRDKGLFGNNSTASRFGAFFLGTGSSGTSTLRMYNYFSWLSSNIQGNISTSVTFMADSRRNPADGAIVNVNGVLNGADMYSLALSSAQAPAPAQDSFYIGSMLPGDNIGNFGGEIAEIRVYNRALNDAERIILQNHLAAHYGVSIGAAAQVAYRGAQHGYELDVVGVGNTLRTDGAYLAGSVTESEDAMGLRLSALNNTLSEDNSFVLFGHDTEQVDGDGWTGAAAGETYVKRWQRGWYFTVTESRGLDVRLVFDFAAAGVAHNPADEHYVLLYRIPTNETYSVVAVEPQVADGRVSFDLLDGRVLNGAVYTLGVASTAAATNRTREYAPGVTPGLQAWFRASDGLTDGGGWNNIGLLGAGLDTSPTGSAGPALIANGALRAAGVYEPVARFSGSHKLLSAEPTTFGVYENLTWFAVFTPAEIRNNNGLFGQSTDTTRFGAFFLGASPYSLRCHAFNANGSTFQCHLAALQTGAVQLGDYRRMKQDTQYSLSALLNGLAEEEKNATQLTPVLDKLAIGHMLGSAINQLNGDIAELRIYNRALTDVERRIVQNHLAARYGFALADGDLYAGKDAANGDCDLDVVGIGCTTNTAAHRKAAAVTESEASGGLRLSALDSALGGTDAFLLAGHNARENAWVKLGGGVANATYRWQREWYLDKTAEEGLGARLVFDFAAAGVTLFDASRNAEYRLLWRADATSAYAWVQDAEPVMEDNVMRVDLPDAKLASGMYTVGAYMPPLGTILIFK